MTIAYLIVTTLLIVAALWMMTATGQPRGIKLCGTLVAAGAIVDVVGLVAAMATGHGYAAIWPGELVLNGGMALLLLEWARLERRQRRRTARTKGAGGLGPAAR
ncbi:hypothetical protein MNO14_01685 [Luteimonas sp. S4-F44]|uniref:hypothetical protein n=1 Tax=Luteimonas sp. S4-F44 TaxID=2925842 RepID=UPI001F536C8E|nr:hypothetical protein [Luteimonas sp. S4-F44]UNK42846.1 hypothetical protein MNO14_01685 [Luteimonas sp. S4-F44]